MEIWKEIKGYEGIYEVSNTGFIRSIERVIIKKDNRKKTIKSKIKQGNHTKGYKRVALYDLNGLCKHCYVHRLVMFAFFGESDLYVDHIDGNKENNNLDNLRYVTNSENLTFRNTNKSYSTKHPYVYFDKQRNEYRVYRFGKRFKSFEEAKEKAICLYGQRQ